MQAQARSRKRAADGSAPDVPYQYPQPQMQDGAFNANDALAAYRNPLTNDVSTHFGDFAAYDTNTTNANAAAANFFPSQLNTTQAPNYGAAVAPPSNQLVRRNTNQQIARTPQRSQWSNFNQPSERVWENMDDEDNQDLDQKAALAKKDAQAKRKQIPPFVQKLSSFLDSSNNTELIRWSDDGNSFIVLDEDEFARTLIPELFKHNNYASFVRQLNMYGFHKKVGLNANSMKAAEKKVKDPSVYWHEYFKRGRPDLLWLIQKPQAKSSSAKRKRDQEKREQGDSDDDRKGSPEAGDSASGPMATIPRTEMQTFRSELQKLQRQQNVISKMIAQLKEQNEQFYRQATAFQALHDRHENSINAILTFLATFYNRSLDGHGAPNLVNMFNNASIPQQTQQQGSVFDMGDGDINESTNDQQLQKFRKQQLLLPPPAAHAQHLASSSPFIGPASSARSSTSPGHDLSTQLPPRAQSQQHQTRHPPPPPRPATTQPQRASVTPVIKDDAPTPDLLSYPENEEMINLINNVNASNSPSNTAGACNPSYDFSSALDHLHTANGNSPLTAQQRDTMLSLIAGQGAGAGSSAAQPGANNALMTPNPPEMPSLDQFAKTQEQLEMLTKLQSEQDSRLAEMNGKLQPLSPTGAIPGMADHNLDLGGPGDFDLSNFVNDSEAGYFTNFAPDGVATSNAPATSAPEATSYPANQDPNNLDFDWDFADQNALGNTDDLFGEGGGGGGGGNEEGGGRVVGSVSSEGTSPVNGEREPNANKADDGETPSKKRRVG